MMRNRFDEQLESLNNSLIRMGALCEGAIANATSLGGLDLYNGNGQELEYRWVESGVYQGDSEENLLQDDGTFTLTQSGREIKYRSEAPCSEDGLSTTIVNRIANTIDYDIEKVWRDETGKPTEAPEGAEVTFVIYQTLSGESLDEDKIVAEVTMDGQADDNKIVVNEKLGLTFQETETAAGKVRLKIF